jgi:dTDP-4-dehydrorhamnose 3,5-epimerase
MKVTPMDLPEVLLIESRVFADERGFFMETWNERTFAQAGIDARFVQDNHSRSVRHTLRGLHYQLPPYAQGKLVRVSLGEVFDVAVDIRKGSPHFGRWVGAYLSADNKRQIWIPPGFAHGFLVTSEVAEFQYKCTDFYAPEHDRNIRWDDGDIGIDWPLTGTPLLSQKDSRAPALADAEIV